MKFDRGILRESHPSSNRALSVCVDQIVQWTSDARRFIEVAGMMIDPAHPIVDVGQNKAIGSLLIVQAENIEEVRKIIEDDIYTQSGVVSGVHVRLLFYSTSTVGQGEARYRAFSRGDTVSCVSLGQRVIYITRRSRYPYHCHFARCYPGVLMYTVMIT